MGIIGIFSGLGSLSTGTTGIRIISSSTQITGGFGTTRVISGISGTALPAVATPGTIGGTTGGAASSMPGWMESAFEIFGIMAIISCITAVLVTTYKVYQYFAEPRRDKVRFTVTEVEEKKGWFKAWCQMHDFSGIFIPLIKAATGAPLQSHHDDWLSRFQRKSMSKEDADLGGWDSTLPTPDYHPDKPMYRFTGGKMYPGVKHAGAPRTMVNVTTREIDSHQFAQDFRHALVNAPSERKLEEEVEKLLIEYAEASAFSEDDEECEDCGNFNMELYPDTLYCVDTRYTVEIRSAARQHNIENGGHAFDPTYQRTLFDGGFLPGWLDAATGGAGSPTEGKDPSENGGEGAPDPMAGMTGQQRAELIAGIMKIQWQWVENEAFEYRLPFRKEIEEEGRKSGNNPTKISFGKLLENPDTGDSETVLEFNWADYNICSDPYYWAGSGSDVALPDEGYSEGDTQSEISYAEWLDKDAVLTEKTALGLDRYGVPQAAVDGEVSFVGDGGFVRTALDGATWEPQYDHWPTGTAKKIGSGKAYQKPIKPLIFMGMNITLFGWGGYSSKQENGHPKGRSLADKINRSTGLSISGSQFGKYNLNSKDRYAAAQKAQDKIAAILGTKDGKVIYPPAPHKVSPSDAVTSSYSTKRKTGAFAVVSDEALHTCDTCKDKDSNGCAVEPDQLSAVGQEAFWIGVPYVFAVKKETKSQADNTNPGWVTTKVKDSNGQDSDWSISNIFTVPCIDKHTKPPTIQIGDMDRARTAIDR